MAIVTVTNLEKIEVSAKNKCAIIMYLWLDYFFAP